MRNIRDTIYGNAWFFWVVNYLLSILKYNTLADKIYLIAICFIVVFLYIGIPFIIEFNKKLQ